MSVWSKLARLLGVRDDQVDDALVDERRARLQMDRRGFLLAGAAVAGGALLAKVAWSVPAPTQLLSGTRVTQDSLNDVLKRLYTDDNIERLVYRSGIAQITRIDHGDGTVTVTSGATLSGLHGDTYLFREGDWIIPSAAVAAPPPAIQVVAAQKPVQLGRSMGLLGGVRL